MSSGDPASASDVALIASVRDGETGPFQVLYERHRGSAQSLAWRLARSSAEVDDLVAEAFANVLDAIRAGSGPEVSFRAYLLTTLRNVAYGKWRRDKKLDLTDDPSTKAGAALSVAFTDPAVEDLERSLAARAFYSLPERWQMVLWHIVIEEQSASEVGALLGLSPNAVHALAHRAREGLRQQYLQVHLSDATDPACREVNPKLGAWTRGGLGQREQDRVDEHLEDCDRCSAMVVELSDVNSSLRSVLPFLVLGGGAAGYLASAGVATAPVAAAAAGAGATGWFTPRNVLGGSVAGVALAAVVALALIGGDDTDRTPSALRNPADAPMSEPEAEPGESNGPESGGSPGESAPGESSDPSVPESSAVPVEAEPVIDASAPEGGVEIVAGAGPVDLEIEVQNTGTAEAANATLALTLPDGVRAVERESGVPASGGQGGGAAGSSVPVVDCPGGVGTVACSTSGGLAPGESAVLRFRLEADTATEAAEVVGVVNVDGVEVDRFTVPVTVDSPPDVAHLVAGQVGHTRLLEVTIRNDGEQARPASVSVDASSGVHRLGGPLECGDGEGSTRCELVRPLEPGESARVWLWVKPWWLGGDWGWGDRLRGVDATVTATVGDDVVSRTTRMECLLSEWLGRDGVPGGEDSAE